MDCRSHWLSFERFTKRNRCDKYGAMKTTLRATTGAFPTTCCLAGTLALLAAAGLSTRAADAPGTTPWTIGIPIVTYWAGPPMTDATASQMAEGGWNLVWCGEKDLDVAGRHGLRAQLQDPLLTPAALDDPGQREKLDGLIGRVSQHPALYDYFVTDEPNATNFPALAKLVVYLRQHDPAHLAYINLFPTYANNAQLGNPGGTIDAYQAHLRQYVDIVKPGLISYDHYQFNTNGDSPDYFLNLSLIRRAALDAGVPFLNIVQAASWTPSVRVPNADEMRYLVYTTLAYGAQGISYYVYCCAGHTGGIANPDGTPTVLYPALKALNRQFVCIASQLKPLRSLGVYHAGMQPPGAEPLPKDAAFRFDPPLPAMAYHPPERVRGAMIGYFGPASRTNRASKTTCALVVNLDYESELALGLRGPGRLEVFDAATGEWSQASGRHVQIHLPPGGGALARVGH